jgi:hypothetical protein
LIGRIIIVFKKKNSCISDKNEGKTKISFLDVKQSNGVIYLKEPVLLPKF